MRTAVITVVHRRHDHLALQEAGLVRSEIRADIRCVVAMSDPQIKALAPAAARVVECDSATGDLPLARARNLGARCALDLGAELLVFLDVDCIPGAEMIGRYVDAYRRVDGDALLAGPVTYLPPSPNRYRLESLESMTNPHPARPAPASGVLLTEPNHDLFWSLSFAVSATAWRRIGGFDEVYVGYGAEDTDFAANAAALNIPLIWVGGADAYHQYHPVSSPPIEHLEAIVANARTFHNRWGRWPMPGWLDAFEQNGALARRGDDIIVTNVNRGAV
ncbi:glycosyltransferase family 2 protein [Mycobacterium deserti]|uniref:glycosyltransferase family 2 protein n=1 Tax=Mycobacterium deserti TaxID=2978347 RepID=UPI0036F35F26